MKRIVVLGCGYLGYHIANYFCGQSFDVIVVGRTNVYKEKLNFRIKFIESDIYDFDKYSLLLNSNTTVFYAAGTINATHSFDYIEKDIDGYKLFVRLLNKLESTNIEQFVFLSSAGTVYGNRMGKVSETEQLQPVNIYGLQKLYFEQLIRLKHLHAGKLNFLIYRISNPYGGYQDPKKTQGIIPILINRALNNQPVDIWVDLETKRDYIYIDDLLRFIHILTFQCGQKNEIYNLASGTSSTLREVISLVEQYTQAKLKINKKTIGIPVISSIEVDITKIITAANQTPLVTLSDGIKMLVDEMKGG